MSAGQQGTDCYSIFHCLGITHLTDEPVCMNLLGLFSLRSQNFKGYIILWQSFCSVVTTWTDWRKWHFLHSLPPLPARGRNALPGAPRQNVACPPCWELPLSGKSPQGDPGAERVSQRLALLYVWSSANQRVRLLTLHLLVVLSNPQWKLFFLISTWICILAQLYMKSILNVVVLFPLSKPFSRPIKNKTKPVRWLLVLGALSL